MKNAALILLLLIFGLPAKSQGIYITSATVTTISEGINVNVQAMSTNGAGFLNSSYVVSGNVIDLTVCYWFNELQPVLTFNNDFPIPLFDSGNYTVNVQIFTSSTYETCDYFSTLGTYTFQHNFLGAEKFSVNNNVKVYPNPSTGIINIVGLNAEVTQIDVTDSLGKIINVQKDFTANKLNLSDLQDGLYFVRLQTDAGFFNKKVLIRR